jgi:tetratricopeptide (TPR) repeat protein
MKQLILTITFSAILLASCASPPTQTTGRNSEANAALVARAGAPLFDGMSNFHHPITTQNSGAQRYFDQGMVLAFGFNHAESIRSFRAAQRLDDSCAMCFWGEALATGPNINVTSNGKAIMSPAERTAAYSALQQALTRKNNASEAERDYIDALAARYNGDAETDREPLDRAYAAAMRDLAQKYPNDDDVAAMFSEAVMNTMPWNYWADDGQPRAETVEVINALETILARSPRHPLAIHLYIHAVEASSDPGRAEAAADQLANLVPGSGHLVHMPAHIYWRVGRYADAAEANVLAAAVDEQYIAQCNAQGFYPAVYYPHNIHFLWAASSMEGRSEVAIEAARKVRDNVPLELVQQFPPVEFFRTIPMLALTQFGRWQEILNEPRPPADLAYSTGIWHYTRGVALSQRGDVQAAREERAALVPLRDSATIQFLDSADYPASMLLKIADELLLGEIAMASGSLNTAIEHFRTAVATQDELPYTEPPFWYYPTRQSLGLALLRAGEYTEAEAVYRRDLQQYPRNGWSMFGLLESLEAQNRLAEARDVRQQFEAIWAMADVTLEASRI